MIGLHKKKLLNLIDDHNELELEHIIDLLNSVQLVESDGEGSDGVIDESCCGVQVPNRHLPHPHLLQVDLDLVFVKKNIVGFVGVVGIVVVVPIHHLTHAQH